MECLRLGPSWQALAPSVVAEPVERVGLPVTREPAGLKVWMVAGQEAGGWAEAALEGAEPCQGQKEVTAEGGLATAGALAVMGTGTASPLGSRKWLPYCLCMSGLSSWTRSSLCSCTC